MDESTQLKTLLTRAADTVGDLHPPAIEVLSRRYRRRQLAVTVLAPVCAVLLVAALAVTFVLTRASHREPPAQPIGVDQLQSYRWTDVPRSPLAARSGSAVAWTGSQLLFWGGQSGAAHYYADGAAYDPTTSQWTMLPPSPLGARGEPFSAWTGHELFVWGGFTRNGLAAGGALYNPATKRWTLLPKAPLEGGWINAGAYALASKVLVLTVPRRPSDTASAYRTVEAALYDPATNRWQREPALHVGGHAPIESLHGVAAGNRLFLEFTWSGDSAARDYSFSVNSRTWSPSRVTAPFYRTSGAMLWTGSRVLRAPVYPVCRGKCPPSLDVPAAGIASNLRTGTSTRLPTGPIDRDQPAYVWTGRVLLGVQTRPPTDVAQAPSPNMTAAWDPSTSTWTGLHSMPVSPAAESLDERSGIWTGTSMFVWTDLNLPGKLRLFQFAPAR